MDLGQVSFRAVGSSISHVNEMTLERRHVFVDQVRNKKPTTITDPNMTRFLMSLGDSVELVHNAQPDDLYVKKAPACAVEVLARAVACLLGTDDPEIRFIDARHGEKLYESLLGREEVVRAEDEGDYFRMPLDARSLEYELYFDEGIDQSIQVDDYNSHNTDRLDTEQVKALLVTLPEMQDQIAKFG